MYTLRAAGAHDTVVERAIPVKVFGDFGVATFTASHESVEIGADVLLEWLVFATDSVRILANGVEVHTDASGSSTGSYLAQNVRAATEFKLIAANADGVENEATLDVDLWPITFGLQASTTTVRPGDPIELTIDARTLADSTPLTVYGVLPLVEDTDPANRYLDISDLPGATNLDIDLTHANTIREIDLPFLFPYMGEFHNKIYAFVHGYTTFTSGVAFSNANQLFPTSVSLAAHAHLAPFWDNMHPRFAGMMHTAPLGPDTFAIQWSKMSMTLGSLPAAPHNLNFQLVLHRNGSFEYRYGTMAPQSSGTSAACHPSTCENEANGSSATIGYQTVSASAGYNFHFGGTNPAPGNPTVPGGLTNRTVRYPVVVGSGSFTFTPNESQILSLCTDTAGGPLCRELEIDVPFGFTGVSLSEEILGYDEFTTLSWESAGGKAMRILDGDRVIFETTTLAEIDSGSIVLRPTQTTVYDLELSAGGQFERVRKVVEVESFMITNSVGASGGPGSPVTVSWNLSSGDPSLPLHVLAPMVEIDNQDFNTFDLSIDPDAIELIGGGSPSGVATLIFEDFVFPYFGTDHTSIRAAADGYLTWASVSSTGNNTRLPDSGPGAANVALAPFWDDLHTRVNGRVLAKKIDDDRYVIQWSRVSLQHGSTETNEGELNFLVVLHRDGTFEYRYGMMRPPRQPAIHETACAPRSCERETNGSSATIGYQLFGGAAGHTIHFGGTNRHIDQPVVAGGLEGRAWRFTPHEATGPGSAVLHPADTTVYRICAYDSASTEVACPPAVSVDVPWGVDLFQANPHAPSPDQPTTLSWSVQGLESLRLFADGVEIASHFAPDIPLLGSQSHTPSAATTTYTLEASSLGRTVTREVVVQQRTLDLHLSGPTGIFEPGDTITLNWELKTFNPDDDVVMVTPMSEVELGANGEHGYVDISQLEGVQELVYQGRIPSSGFAPATIPFPFPYLGTVQTQLKVYAAGYISFAAAGGDGNTGNTVLPTGAESGTLERVHMAVFWDDVTWYDGDKSYAYAPDPDTFIIQWKGFSRRTGSSESVRYDLNFQVVLRSDGSFDYRYGTMAPPAPPFSHESCKPHDCSSEANGSSATIGYQTVDAIYGQTMHIGSLAAPVAVFGRVTDDPSNDGFLAFPGGLSNRSFRYTPAPTGSSRVVLGRTVDHQVCAITRSFGDCVNHHTEVVAVAGDLMITELMIDPFAGPSAQWLEVRNLTSRMIDLEGFRLASTSGEHRIASPLAVGPGEAITLAASDAVPFTPDYVYGGDLPLDRNIDNVELLVGQATIASAAWGISWSIPRNQSLSLDPRYHLTGMHENPEFEKWCLAGPEGSPGSVGEGCTDPYYDIDPISDRPFLDIAQTGSRFPEIEGDNRMARLPLAGFRPKLFGQSHSRIWVSSSGFFSLHDFYPTTSASWAPPTRVPRNAGQLNTLKGPLVAVFWDSLQCGGHCRAYYEVRNVDGSEVFIFQWEDYYLGAHRIVPFTFQTQLWENGDVIVAFGPVSNPYLPGSTSWTPHEGGGAVIGLESADGSLFLDAHSRRALGLDRRTIHFKAK